MAKLNADEKKWRAESDARTLMEAEEIKTQKTRFGSALREVKNIANSAEQTAKKAKKLAGSKKPKKPKKPTKRKKKR